jgi:hypothetical protein
VTPLAGCSSFNVIIHVVEMRPWFEVFWIAASRVVTEMPNVQFVIKFAIFPYPGNPVSSRTIPDAIDIPAKHPIAMEIQGASVGPAIIL